MTFDHAISSFFSLAASVNMLDQSTTSSNRFAALPWIRSPMIIQSSASSLITVISPLSYTCVCFVELCKMSQYFVSNTLSLTSNHISIFSPVQTHNVLVWLNANVPRITVFYVQNKHNRCRSICVSHRQTNRIDRQTDRSESIIHVERAAVLARAVTPDACACVYCRHQTVALSDPLPSVLIRPHFVVIFVARGWRESRCYWSWCMTMWRSRTCVVPATVTDFAA